MKDLSFFRIATLGTVILAFPVAAILVFTVGVDRSSVADVLSLVFGIGLFTAIFSSLLPFTNISRWSRLQRVESLVLIYLGISYVSHLSWELGWLIGHDWILANADSPWAYMWWAYIDGGDARYAAVDETLVVMELLSVTNGVIGITALTQYLLSGRKNKTAILVMAGTAVVHLYSATLYYLSEMLYGLPNVGDGFISIWIIFGLANAPWVIGPWFAFWWCREKLITPSPETSAD
jgi:hypothetical protein